MTNDFKKEIKIIKCNSIELREKDVIEVTHLGDFTWLIAGEGPIYDLNGVLYILTDSVAFVYKKTKS